ncbi:hypothetical protein IGB42_02089 [Andreprevotia sp. IGB-42]|uniref:DUF3422 family protein n=1 Tax=Andreprevotia sp. IGB-42 TaxID=2497473 RepID=UPI0013595956|nr:DUF3422 domain-containing protein [Andreprevotia sp. IGB-42]KAF0813161.1 hypothetical protein IGB42_02089 [Andreprevotia sp. IGB-42]
MDAITTAATFEIKLNDHPQRRVISDEAHARPYALIPTPSRITYIAYLHRNLSPTQELWLYGELALRFGQVPPKPGDNHFSVDLGPCRLRWTRHSEFSALTLIASGLEADPFRDPFARPALAELPAEWLAQLPGNLLVAAHALLVPHSALPIGAPAIAARYFRGNDLIGAEIGEGSGSAYTDFLIHADGFSRYLVADRYMGRRQGGRMLLRLFELDTYRMMAFLALPLAKSISPELTEADRELAELTSAMSHAKQTDEPVLLDRLTQLAARIESALSRTDFRFSATHAYYEIVQSRIAELREYRIQGLQPFQQFMERRLTPAMDTCVTVARRQRELAARVSRATALLRTRVDITHEQQNQALLTSMERRATLQLRLQETVEGLSIAAITYYTVGLLGYGFKGLKAAGMHLNVELATALAIPVVALLIALGLRRMRNALLAEHG